MRLYVGMLIGALLVLNGCNAASALDPVVPLPLVETYLAPLPKDQPQPMQMVVTLAADEQNKRSLYWNGTRYDLATSSPEFTTAVKKVSESKKWELAEVEVGVRADNDMPFEDLSTLAKLLKSQGFTRIALAVQTAKSVERNIPIDLTAPQVPDDKSLPPCKVNLKSKEGALEKIEFNSNPFGTVKEYQHQLASLGSPASFTLFIDFKVDGDLLYGKFAEVAAATLGTPSELNKNGWYEFGTKLHLNRQLKE